jgi:hypothetical protein
MIKSTNRQVFSENLRMAVVADQIASSLRQISKRRRLEDWDRRVIGVAGEFLTETRRGRDATKSMKVEESLQASLAYGQAIQAIQLNPARFASYESFEKLIASLEEQLKEIGAARTFDIGELYEFFTAIRELAMTGDSRKFESVSVSGVE